MKIKGNNILSVNRLCNYLKSDILDLQKLTRALLLFTSTVLLLTRALWFMHTMITQENFQYMIHNPNA